MINASACRTIWMIWQRSCSNSTFVRKSDPISSEKFSEGNLWQSDRLGDKFDILCDTLKEKRNRADSRVHFWGARQLRRPTYRLFRARNLEFYANMIKIYLPTWSLCLFSRHPTIKNHTDENFGLGFLFGSFFYSREKYLLIFVCMILSHYLCF